MVSLCLACASDLPPRQSSHYTKCCSRPICPQCVRANPRLVRYDPCIACAIPVPSKNTTSLIDIRNGLSALTPPPPDEEIFILGDDGNDDDNHRFPNSSSITHLGNDLSLTPPPAYAPLSSDATLASTPGARADAVDNAQYVPREDVDVPRSYAAGAASSSSTSTSTSNDNEQGLATQINYDISEHTYHRDVSLSRSWDRNYEGNRDSTRITESQTRPRIYDNTHSSSHNHVQLTTERNNPGRRGSDSGSTTVKSKSRGINNHELDDEGESSQSNHTNSSSAAVHKTPSLAVNTTMTGSVARPGAVSNDNDDNINNPRTRPTVNAATAVATHHIQKTDTLRGIALRYGVDGHTLCKANNLPPSTLSTTPHLLFTRAVLYVPRPATAKIKAGNISSSLSTPHRDNSLDERERERERAEARRRARRAFSAVTGERDARVADAYVGVAEMEVEDGDGVLFDAGDDDDYDYDYDDMKEEKKRIGEGSNKNGETSTNIDTAARAIGKYVDDDAWERGHPWALVNAGSSGKSGRGAGTSAGWMGRMGSKLEGKDMGGRGGGGGGAGWW